MSEVTWRDRTIAVKSEQVRVLLLSVHDLAQQLDGTESLDSKLSLYESLLKELIDAQQALREDLKDDPVSILWFQLIITRSIPLCILEPC